MSILQMRRLRHIPTQGQATWPQSLGCFLLLLCPVQQGQLPPTRCPVPGGRGHVCLHSSSMRGSHSVRGEACSTSHSQDTERPARTSTRGSPCWLGPAPRSPASGGLEWAQECARLTVPRDARLLGATVGALAQLTAVLVTLRCWLLQARPGFREPVWRPGFGDRHRPLDRAQLGAARLQPFWMSQPGGPERLGPWCSAGAHKRGSEIFLGKKNPLRRKIRQHLDSFRVKQ